MQYISRIDVVYGDELSQEPPSRVLERTSQSDDINNGFGGKFVWLVPVFTADSSAAVTGFNIVIQKDPGSSLSDLAKGAGGDYRYLLPIQTATQVDKVTEVVLSRTANEMTDRPAGWNGNTKDINKGRGGSYLYLLWKTAA